MGIIDNNHRLWYSMPEGFLFTGFYAVVRKGEPHAYDEKDALPGSGRAASDGNAARGRFGGGNDAGADNQFGAGGGV